MAKEKCITRSFPTVVVKLEDGSAKEFPNMKQEDVETLCMSLNLPVESVFVKEIVYKLPHSEFLKYATRC